MLLGNEFRKGQELTKTAAHRQATYGARRPQAGNDGNLERLLSGWIDNPHIKALCERLTARGKSTMSMLGAAMRKRVHLCFGVWKTRQPYQANYLASA